MALPCTKTRDQHIPFPELEQEIWYTTSRWSNLQGHLASLPELIGLKEAQTHYLSYAPCREI